MKEYFRQGLVMSRDHVESPRSGQPLPAEVASRVRQRLLNGAYPPGHRIKLEALAQEASVSVTPVREALLILCSEGLVELVPRRGFIVARLSRQDVLDAFWVQAEIRGELAARATQRMSEGDLSCLSEQLADAEGALQTQDMGTFDSIITWFDQRVNRSADSPKLEWFLERSLRITPAEIPTSSINWRQDVYLTHYRHLLDAFVARTPGRARDALREHTWKAGVAYLRHLEQAGFWT